MEQTLERARTIDRAHRPTREEFRERWLVPGRPVLMTGMLEDWPAFGRWTPAFFRRLGGDMPVRIEWGNVLQEAPRFETRPLAWFLDRIEDLDARASGGPPAGEGPVPYLAYFDIFKAFPSLRSDVRFDFWKGRIRIPIGWIGPAGTFTGLHWDVAPNLFAQFHGAKEFTLYPPEEGRCLYPARKYDIGSVLSEVDVRRPDPVRHPRFREARGMKVEVRAGDLLFTPRGWWHSVLGLSASISVSCFGFGVAETLRDGLPGAVKHGLHRLGLYRRGECACHM